MWGVHGESAPVVFCGCMARVPLSSLNLLRAFEAAGRLMSFRDAAKELHVTPAAVSQPVRQLEEELGLTFEPYEASVVTLEMLQRDDVVKGERRQVVVSRGARHED